MALTGNLSNRNGGKTSEVGLGRPLSRALNYNGVLTVNDLAVSAQGSPNNTVEVAVGDCLIGNVSPSASTYSYYAWLPTAGAITIANNTSGSARIDVIVAYIDLSVVSTSSNDNPGALKVDVVPGTPAGSPVPPNTSAIQTQIGASNPFIILAQIAVANGFSTITSSNITDVRQFAGIYSSSFPFTPNPTGISSPTIFYAVSTGIGKQNKVDIGFIGTGSATSMTFTLPFLCARSISYLAFGSDNGNPQAVCLLQTTSGSATVTCANGITGGSWTASGARGFFFSGFIEGQ